MLAQVAGISQFPGFSKWVFAGEHAAPPAAAYQPVFFSAAEFHTLDVLSEVIIPADETPGAHAAGVSEFIDFYVSHDAGLQFPFRTGIAWLNAFAAEKYGKSFVDLASSDQEKLLTNITDEPGKQFFALARKYTVIGYYTSRIGLEELDYPGLRIYSSSPECTHTANPEHKF